MNELRELLKNSENSEIPCNIIKEELENGSRFIVQGNKNCGKATILRAITTEMKEPIYDASSNHCYDKTMLGTGSTIFIYMSNGDSELRHIESITKLSEKGLRTICIYTNGRYQDFREYLYKKGKTA